MAPGITVLERGWLSSNNVVLHGSPGGPALLVDTGYVTHAAQTVALVEAALKGQPLAAVVNTHLHSDHCGGNSALVKRFGCELLIPPGDFDTASRWDEERLSFLDTGQRCDRFVPTDIIAPATVLPAPFSDWEIHAAPGHDPASVVLFQPEHAVLISADALWENGFGIVFPALDGSDAFGELEDTLMMIERLSPRQVIPGHGSAFFDTAAALERAHQRLDYFRREPERHARHAVKALVMFHLLEMVTPTAESLADWMGRTPIFQRVFDTFFASAPGASAAARAFALGLTDELAASGALVRMTGPDGSVLLRPT